MYVLWQFQAFEIVTAVILLYEKQIFSAQFLRMELSTVARLIYQKLLSLSADLHNFGIIWKANERSLQVCKNQNFMKSINVTHFRQ